MIVQFVSGLVLLFTILFGGQAVLRAYPGPAFHVFIPAAFAVLTWYIICLFKDKFKDYFQLTLHILIVAYLGWCFYMGLIGLDRYLAGQEIFPAEPNSWLDILLGVAGGLLLGSVIYGLRVLYERYERRKAARNMLEEGQ